MERLRTEGEEHARLLSQDAAKAREAASAARAEAARARNEAEYERDRAARLQEQLRDAHRQAGGAHPEQHQVSGAAGGHVNLAMKSHILDCTPGNGPSSAPRLADCHRAVPFDPALRKHVGHPTCMVQVLVNDLQQRVSALDADITCGA